MEVGCISKNWVLTLLLLINTTALTMLILYNYSKDTTYTIAKEHDDVIPYAYKNLTKAKLISCYKKVEKEKNGIYILTSTENVTINTSCISQYRLFVRHIHLNKHFNKNKAKLIIKYADAYYEVFENNEILQYKIN